MCLSVGLRLEGAYTTLSRLSFCVSLCWSEVGLEGACTTLSMLSFCVSLLVWLEGACTTLRLSFRVSLCWSEVGLEGTFLYNTQSVVIPCGSLLV